jgi:hypothetical protein
VAGGETGRPVIGVARHSSATSSGAWSADSKRVAYVSSGRVFVAKPGSGARPREVDIGSGRSASFVAFAPIRRRTILAFVDRGGSRNGDALCWLDITGDKDTAPSCGALPGWRLAGIVWSPRGTEILVPASGDDGFGLLRASTARSFSPASRDWSVGRTLVTRTRKGRGVRAVAYGPDAKRLAVVSNLDTRAYRVALVKPKELNRNLKSADYLSVRGCDVAWRPDGAELAVIQAGGGCRHRVGRLIRVRTADPWKRRTIASSARHPSWEPIGLSAP